jgi:hypothetical protein
VADTGVGPHPCLNHVQDIGAFIDGAALAALLSANPDYRALPRDEMRAQMARVLIQQHCRDIGLQAEFQGKGVPELR